jgi:hypothetical protein
VRAAAGGRIVMAASVMTHASAAPAHLRIESG